MIFLTLLVGIPNGEADGIRAVDSSSRIQNGNRNFDRKKGQPASPIDVFSFDLCFVLSQ